MRWYLGKKFTPEEKKERIKALASYCYEKQNWGAVLIGSRDILDWVAMTFLTCDGPGDMLSASIVQTK